MRSAIFIARRAPRAAGATSPTDPLDRFADSDVTNLEIRDLAHAKVFVTALQSERAKEAMKGLKAVAVEVRYRLARAVNLRHVPELHFHYDESVDRGERIDNLLRDLRTSDDSE